MIVDFKPRFFFDPAVRAADVRQKIEARFRIGFQKRTRRHDVFARHDDRDLVERINHVGDPLRMFTLERRHQR